MTQMTTASEAINEGDGMAACLQDVQELHRRMYGMEENGAEVRRAPVGRFTFLRGASTC